MPNWYYGNVTIRGNIKPFQDWYLKNKEEEENFAETFVPLSSGKWDYNVAVKEWGTKWDLSDINVYCGEDENDTAFSFSFQSAWSPPIYLWKQLEKRYNVEVEEYGYEEQQLAFHKYHKGRNIWEDRDYSWFEDRYDFRPSNEAKEDSDIYDEELMELKFEYWDEALNEWNDELKDDNDDWEDVDDTDLSYDTMIENISKMVDNMKTDK